MSNKDEISVRLNKKQLVAAMFEMSHMYPYNAVTVILDDGTHTMGELMNQMALQFTKMLDPSWHDDVKIAQWKQFSQQHKSKGDPHA
jgi:hypothetical protein